MTTQSLSVGEPAPWFSAAASSNRTDMVAFDELAGRHIVLFFFDSAARPEIADILTAFGRRGDLFDDRHATFVGISRDPQDFERDCVRRRRGSCRVLWDVDGTVAQQYGVADPSGVRPAAFVLDPALQILDIAMATEPVELVERITTRLGERLANPPAPRSAPVLVVPNVFDRLFCDRLVELYEATGGREIGAIEFGGKVVEKFDPEFRKRLDWYISDNGALQRARYLLQRRLLPMVHQGFQFNTTRIERYLVGCYDAITGGHFRAHRDNMSPVAAHRRFAVTINLNDAYEGGQLTFPEFGPQTYGAAPGDAIVFSCSLLHEVVPVTSGRRYAFLSFLYDEQGQQIRDAYAKQFAASQKSVAAN